MIAKGKEVTEVGVKIWKEELQGMDEMEDKWRDQSTTVRPGLGHQFDQRSQIDRIEDQGVG